MFDFGLIGAALCFHLVYLHPLESVLHATALRCGTVQVM